MKGNVSGVFHIIQRTAGMIFGYTYVLILKEFHGNAGAFIAGFVH